MLWVLESAEGRRLWEKGSANSTATTDSTGSRSEFGWTKGDLWISFMLEVGICGTETEKRQSWALAAVFWDREEGAEGSKHLWGDGEDSLFSRLSSSVLSPGPCPTQTAEYRCRTKSGHVVVTSHIAVTQ